MHLPVVFMLVWTMAGYYSTDTTKQYFRDADSCNRVGQALVDMESLDLQYYSGTSSYRCFNLMTGEDVTQEEE